jgi:hypothetical protein
MRPGMTTTADPSLLRKRKTVEVASFAARGARHRLAGALVVWAVTSVGFALAMKLIPYPSLRAGELLTAIVIGLIVAILCGIQGDAYSRQVKELERARQALHHQAHHDALTGLPNRDQLASYASGQRGRAPAGCAPRSAGRSTSTEPRPWSAPASASPAARPARRSASTRSPGRPTRPCTATRSRRDSCFRVAALK